MNPDPELLVRHLAQQRETKPMVQPDPDLPGPISPLERETGVPISRLQVVTLRPGDLLVVSVPVPITAMLADQMAKRLKALAPDGIEVAIVSDDLDLTIYRKVEADG